MKMQSQASNGSGYVHGYSERETKRLREQCAILENIMHNDTSYSEGSLVLEAGCGVGAQTRILAAQSQGARITSVDISEPSLSSAKRMIEAEGHLNVEFRQADINDLPFKDGGFDHVFVCFVLEHLVSPVQALRELRRVLKPGGDITVIEGDHGSCFWHPETDASMKVWESFIKVQQELGQDPNIGRRLSPIVKKAGFRIEHSSPRYVYGDLFHADLLDGMVNKIIVPMVQTGRDNALKNGFIDEVTWDRGIEDLLKTVDGTFFYTWFKVVGRKVI